ncbi:PREDICTED: myoD family inhibitor domain-containing protein [Cyprinodon variegatus]|uniref:myoD family inhibitor domain-containing protein n=1 Tax=Cyprinodon variegatus TaxID=28743 RepID=UPI000742B268|nr:PREDICTED: myoD family inhibitor domain-containing protein [Cyprinodon variegatus]
MLQEEASVETRGKQNNATEVQPPPGPALLTEASQLSDALKKPGHDLQRPTCPRCGVPVTEKRLKPASQLQSQPQGTVHSGHKGSDSRRGRARSNQPAPTPADSCFQLLLACLWCRFSAVLLGVLEASSCCLQGLCSSCCHACSSCCSAIQDAPAEEFSCPTHCHSVLFESCCEPTEFLEFCLDCCEICHRG